MTTLQRVIQVVAEVFEANAADLSAELRFLEDLGATSLDVVTLVWRIEEVFSLGELDEEDLKPVETIGELALLVESRLGGAPSEAQEVFDLAIGADHAGVNLKAALVDWLKKEGHTVQDLGPSDGTAVDYPDFASRVARFVAEGHAKKGVLICGSGVGMSIAANKVPGVRAVLAAHTTQAELSRRHNNANVLCLGERLTGTDLAIACLRAFLNTPFDPGDDGRHRRRVGLIHALESSPEDA